MQEQGLIGRMVGGMIRGSVRRRFHTVYWTPPARPLAAPAILYANHHGWMDGYLMFHLVSKLDLPSVDWIEEFDAFPLFRFVGGMRFAKGDVAGRVRTVRKTIGLMEREKRSLVIFPEGILHRPPELLPFGKALATVAKRIAGATLVPVAIQYEMALHERPEAFMTLGEPHGWTSLEDCQSRLGGLLQRRPERAEILVSGTLDVNERMDMRRMPGGRKIR